MLVGLTLPGLAIFYRAPIDAENDFRPLITTMRAYARPGDGALATYIWAEGIVASYAPDLHSRLTWRRDVFDADTAEASLAPFAAAHARIWVLNFRRDPNSQASGSAYWLRARRALLGTVDGGAIKAQLFGRPTVPSELSAQQNARFDTGASVRFAPIKRHCAPGDAIQTMLIWSTTRALEPDTALFMHLLRADNMLAVQSDGDALNGLAPAFTWKIGQLISDPRGLLLPPDIASGTYRLVAGMYRPRLRPARKGQRSRVCRTRLRRRRALSL